MRRFSQRFRVSPALAGLLTLQFVAVPELSLTEKQIVLGLAAGRNTREIAADIGLDERTVDWHIARARRKLEQVSALQRRVDRQISKQDRPASSSATGDDSVDPCG
jgi:DNA-binding CsgD family transcriptional regulator